MDHDDDHYDRHHLSTPLLEERSRVKCVKYPWVYHACVPRSALVRVANEEEEDATVAERNPPVPPGGLIHIAPSHGYPDILEVRHVQHTQQLVQYQDRLTHVDGLPISSLEHLRQQLSLRGDKDPQNKEEVVLRLMRKKNPYVEYVDMDEASLSTSFTSADFSGEDDDSSLLTLLMTGGGCISFSPSTTSSSLASSLTSSNGSGGGYLQIPSRGGDLPLLQPYESWGDEAALDIHGIPLFCFPLVVYEVVQGDTLPLLARAFSLKVDDLRRLNRNHFPIGEPGMLVAGQLLRVRNVDYDANATALLVSRKQAGDWRLPPTKTNNSLSQSVPSSEDVENGAAEGGLWSKRLQHVVARGETMTKICQQYRISELDVRRLNRNYFPIGERSVLREGMCLVMYPCPSSPSPVGAMREKGLLAPTGGSSTSSSRSSSSGSSSTEGGGDGRPVLFPIVDVSGVV